MNRETLFGRLSATRQKTSVGRRESHLVGLEPLEDRKMLAFTVIMNDNWVNASTPGADVNIGDYVRDEAGGASYEYGYEAYGSIVGYGGKAGATTFADALSFFSLPGTGNRIEVMSGTYKESDILVNTPITIIGVGPTPALIVPEVVSNHSVTTDFGNGSHSAFLIYSPSVTLSNLQIDGNGNSAALGGTTMNYHHGITTVYDTQTGAPDGPAFVTQRGVTAAPNNLGADEVTSVVKISNVTVSNVWWHGITISGVASQNQHKNRISNVTVTNVGQAGSRDLDRIGILLQNQDQSDVQNATVSNVGVGIANRAFGNITFGSGEGARNKSGIRLTTVTDAEQRAYSISNADGAIDINYILDDTAIFTGFNANKAIFTNPANNAIGLYVNHSENVIIGFESTGAKIGAKVENTTVANLLAPVFAATTLIGPGSGVAGSVGILADNTNDLANPASFGIAGSVNVSGFETGLKAKQVNPLAEKNTMLVDRPTLTGNGTAISVGDNSLFQGNSNTANAVVTTGNGTLKPGFPDSYFFRKTLEDWAGPYSDVVSSGNVNLSSGSTFDALITGQTGTQDVFDFSPVVENGYYPFGLIPPAPTEGRVADPYGTSMGTGNMNQSGGTLRIENGAMNGPLSLAYGLLNHYQPSPDPNLVDYPYLLDTVDMSNYSTLNIVAKLGSGNLSKTFIFGLSDVQGHLALFTIPTNQLNSTTYSTISINLAAPGIPVSLGDDDGDFDLTKVAGYAILGDNGLYNGALNIPFQVTFDKVFAGSILNSSLNVTGSVTLGGSELNVSLTDGYTPTMGQQFTIINNDGVDPINGTFNGIAQNGTKKLNGVTYKVNYFGGDGNDVVLTVVADVGGNSKLEATHVFYNNTKFDGRTAGADPLDDNAIDTTKSLYNGLDIRAPINAFTSFTGGINGLMFDVSGTHGTFTASDFVFKTGANGSVSTWVNAPAPSFVSVRPGAGVNGSDRVEVMWGTDAVKNAWMQVTIEGNDATGGNNTNTGLQQSTVLYIANHIGDTFENPINSSSVTNAQDESAVRGSTMSGRPVTNAYDFSKDGLINANDEIAARLNTSSLTRNLVYTAPAAVPSAAPATDEDSNGVVASALAAKLPAAAKGSSWITDRLAKIDLNSGPIAKLFTHLAEADTARSRALLQAANEITDALDLDDSLLESLVHGLG